MNFSQNSALLPIYTLDISNTKDVRELVGGGTLTRQLQDHSLALKYVYKLPSKIKLKARVGYKVEYLQETKDETLGKGLFDYAKTIAGMEIERATASGSDRAGIDYYLMRYPNYQSLVTEDAYQNSIDTATYSELSSQAGTNVLDYSACALFIDITRPVASRLTGNLHYDFCIKSFSDQKIAQRSGPFSSELRRDMIHYLTLGVQSTSSRVIVGLSDRIQYYDSNQNTLSVAPPNYTERAYAFVENSVLPSITFLLGDRELPLRLSFSWELSSRTYLNRLAQYADTDYKTEKLQQTFNTLGCSFVYPLTPTFSWKFITNYRDAASNMKFEKNYMYNYYTFNYFTGITWEL